jgi:hypothetical protein
MIWSKLRGVDAVAGGSESAQGDGGRQSSTIRNTAAISRTGWGGTRIPMRRLLFSRCPSPAMFGSWRCSRTILVFLA